MKWNKKVFVGNSVFQGGSRLIDLVFSPSTAIFCSLFLLEMAPQFDPGALITYLNPQSSLSLPEQRCINYLLARECKRFSAQNPILFFNISQQYAPALGNAF